MFCRLHKLLAQDPALRWKESSASSLLGATSLDAQDREAKACACVDQAIRKAFFTVDREILDKSRDENGRDGSTALVVLRMGKFPSELVHSNAWQFLCYKLLSLYHYPTEESGHMKAAYFEHWGGGG